MISSELLFSLAFELFWLFIVEGLFRLYVRHKQPINYSYIQCAELSTLIMLAIILYFANSNTIPIIILPYIFLFIILILKTSTPKQPATTLSKWNFRHTTANIPRSSTVTMARSSVPKSDNFSNFNLTQRLNPKKHSTPNFRPLSLSKSANISISPIIPINNEDFSDITSDDNTQTSSAHGSSSVKKLHSVHSNARSNKEFKFQTKNYLHPLTNNPVISQNDQTTTSNYQAHDFPTTSTRPTFSQTSNIMQTKEFPMIKQRNSIPSDTYPRAEILSPNSHFSNPNQQTFSTTTKIDTRPTLKTQFNRNNILTTQFKPIYSQNYSASSLYWPNGILERIKNTWSYPHYPDAPNGMHNPGNLCFMNATIQSLRSISQLHSLLYDYTYKPEYKGMLDTINSIISSPDGSKSCDTIEIAKSLSNYVTHLIAHPNFSFQGQQDAGEFLLCLLATLNTAYQPSIQTFSLELSTLATQYNLNILESNNLEKLRQTIHAILANAVGLRAESFSNDLNNLAKVEWALHTREHGTPIYSHFCGQLVEARHCLSCGGLSASLEAFTLLPLSIPDISGDLPLEVLLENFTCVEGMGGKEKLRCPRCSKTNITNQLNGCQGISSNGIYSQENGDIVTKSVENNLNDKFTHIPNPHSGLQDGERRALITRHPPCIILQLSRFYFEPSNNFTYKNAKRIQFPLRALDISTFHYDCVVNHYDHHYLYDLQAVIVHSNGSSAMSGHYVAYIRHNSKWWLCNDTSVSYIENMEAEKNRNYILENAYILFYTLQQPPTPTQSMPTST